MMARRSTFTSRDNQIVKLNWVNSHLPILEQEGGVLPCGRISFFFELDPYELVYLCIILDLTLFVTIRDLRIEDS